MEKHGNKQRTQTAQGMVEFALILPVLLLIVLGILAFGHLFFVYSATASASREAARYGSAVGLSENSKLRFQDCVAIRAAAIRVGSFAGVEEGDITITYDDGNGTIIATCPVGSSTISLLNANRDVKLGDRITVHIATDYQSIVPIVNIPPFPIKSHSSRTILRNVEVGTAPVEQNPGGSSKKGSKVMIVEHDPNPSAINEEVSVKVKVELDGAGSDVPTGTVTISAPGVSCGNVTLDVFGYASCKMTFTEAGVKTITATYNGDSNFNGASIATDHIVKYPTKLTVSVSPDTITDPGQPLTITVSVEPNPAPAPGVTLPSITGDISITFADGTEVSECAGITAPGGTCVFTPLTGQNYLFKASYPGDSFFNSSVGEKSHTVNSNLFANITLQPQSGEIVVGTKTKIYFTVEKIPPATTPISGSVTVTDQLTGRSCIGNVSTGYCEMVFETAGDRNLRARLNSDSNYMPSESTLVAYRVSKAPTKIIATTNTSTAGKTKAVFNWTIVRPDGTPFDGGATFTGNMKITTVSTAEPAINATVTVTNFTYAHQFTKSGTVKVKLEYAGDSNYLGSSTEIEHVVDYDCVKYASMNFEESEDGSKVYVQLNKPSQDLTIEKIEFNWPKDLTGEDSYLQKIQFDPSNKQSNNTYLWSGFDFTPIKTYAPGQPFTVCASDTVCNEVWKALSNLNDVLLLKRNEKEHILTFFLSRGLVQTVPYEIKIYFTNDTCYAFEDDYQRPMK